jgi:histidine decarboxylase
MENYMKNYTSTEKKYCEGSFGPYYVLGINLSVAKCLKFIKPETSALNGIISFDKAEICGTNLGQTNMIKVSSFCGPKGLIWGYDICKAPRIKHLLNKDLEMDIYDLLPLQDAFQKLIGTVEQKRFPILPGSLVPCAYKMITHGSPCLIYSAEGIGIPEDRKSNACLLMEDVGIIELDESGSMVDKSELDRQSNLIHSIFEIGKNQNIRYREIFVGCKSLVISTDEIGCALVASPYILLANDAILPGSDLFNSTIGDWEISIKKRYGNHA